jgi:hypothetical protein
LKAQMKNEFLGGSLEIEGRVALFNLNGRSHRIVVEPNKDYRGITWFELIIGWRRWSWSAVEEGTAQVSSGITAAISTKDAIYGAATDLAEEFLRKAVGVEALRTLKPSESQRWSPKLIAYAQWKLEREQALNASQEPPPATKAAAPQRTDQGSIGMYHAELRRDPVYQRALKAPSGIIYGTHSSYGYGGQRGYENRKARAICLRLDHLIRRAVNPYKKWISYAHCSAIMLILELLERSRQISYPISWVALSPQNREELEERITYCKKVVAQCHEESRLCGTPLVTSDGFREYITPFLGRYSSPQSLIVGDIMFDYHNPNDFSRAVMWHWE